MISPRARSGRDSISTGPPLSATRRMPPSGTSPPSPKTIEPGAHDGSAPDRTCAMTCDRPSAMDNFLNVSPAKNPIHRPSGEKNGSRASIVSLRDRGFSAVSRRFNSSRGASPAATAMYAIIVPFGETAIWFSSDAGKFMLAGRTNGQIRQKLRRWRSGRPQHHARTTGDRHHYGGRDQSCEQRSVRLRPMHRY